MSNEPTARAVPAAEAPRQSKAGAIVLLILGILLTVLSVGPLLGGAALAELTARQDRDGFLYSPAADLAAGSYALTSVPARIESDQRRFPAEFASISIRVAPQGDEEIFVGLAGADDVDRYLGGVNHTKVSRVRFDPLVVDYRDIPGSSPPGDPSEQDFWAVSDEGPGTREIATDIRSGDWVLVVMNADGEAGVDVSARAGFRSALIAPIAAGLIVLGVVLLLLGVPLLVLGALGVGRGTPSSGREVAAPGAGATAALGAGDAGTEVSAVALAEDRRYPARLTGELSAPLSRGLWLVKWLLAIPHYVILLFLWVAFVVTTIIAWFAILFTARYPRALFNFNVGVLRWSWRVAFYSYAALGTDKYPPFTLASVPYPADFTIEYPERLSRGLVLVKWWLLAIPHLVIVSAITGAAWWSAQDDDGYRRVAGFSLLGALVLIAGVILLFAGRYQRPLFDFIMGLNRWTYRVTTYVGLFRDEYPPFRLDQGPDEPPVRSPR